MTCIWVVGTPHLNHRGVAQLGRAPALGAGGRRFKSCHPDHKDLKRAGDPARFFMSIMEYKGISQGTYRRFDIFSCDDRMSVKTEFFSARGA